jgi:hypothetical protein
MKRGDVWGFSLLICLAGLSSDVIAGDLTVFTGFQKAGRLTLSNTPGTISGVVTGDTNWGGVFGMRYSGGRILGFEPSIGFSPNFLNSSVSALDVQGNLILNAPLPGFTPYATVGAGLVGSWGDSVKSIGTKFAINYGGGVKIKNLAGPIGIRFDLRGYTTTNAFGGDSSFAKQNVNFLEGTIGLLISF